MPPPEISDVLLSDFGETVCNSQGICTFDLNNTECENDILPEPPLPPPGKYLLLSIILIFLVNLNVCISFNGIHNGIFVIIYI